MAADRMSRSGFVALAGRPNVGKSTLVNAIVGSKVAIVSDKPQTTRRAIRGIANGARRQLVLVDLPGVQRPRDALTERMQRAWSASWPTPTRRCSSSTASRGMGPGDRFIARTLRAPALRRHAVNKIGPARPPVSPRRSTPSPTWTCGRDVFPVSAAARDRRRPLVDRSTRCCRRRRSTSRQRRRDQPRDSACRADPRAGARRTFQEVPHAVEVEIDEVERARRPGRGARAPMDRDRVAEGHPDRRRRAHDQAIGTAARASSSPSSAAVHLDLSVRVRRGWRGDDPLLDRLGIEP